MKTGFTAHELSQFTATEHWHRHAINRKVFFTDGVKYVAERAEAYWLIDEVALTQHYVMRVAAQEFQVWNLQVNADSSAQLVCEDGNHNALYTKTIPFTDFPGEGIILWFTNNTILLPSEY